MKVFNFRKEMIVDTDEHGYHEVIISFAYRPGRESDFNPLTGEGGPDEPPSVEIHEIVSTDCQDGEDMYDYFIDLVDDEDLIEYAETELAERE